MVGVPGRSKACVTCRKRRKGCDFGRPTCAQCRKQGLQCGGYDHPRVFVVSTPDARQMRYSAAPPSTNSSSSSSSSSSVSQGQISRSWSQHATITTSCNSSKAATGTDIVATHLHQLSRPADEHRCLDSFWEAYFPSGRPIPESSIRSYTCAWALTARDAWKDDDSLRYALWANALLITNKRTGEDWMRREGSMMYGRALGDLRKSLGAGSSGVMKETCIATVKLLSMFEALMHGKENDRPCSSQDSTGSSSSWKRHNAGELALFLARKPEAHREGNAHHIYADERVEMALSSILQRKRLIFDTPAWKTIPWQVTRKNLKDVLVDVLVDIPGLIEDLDTMIRQLRDLELSSCSSPTEQDTSTASAAAIAAASILRNKLVAKCLDCDRKLCEWSHLVFQLPKQLPTSPGLADEKPRRCISNATCKSEISHQALVIHVAQVHGMALYWTACLVLFTILQRASTAYLSFESPPPPRAIGASFDQDRESSDRLNPLTHARHLVDAIAVLLEPSAGLYGQRSAALPLEIALEYIGDAGGTPTRESSTLCTNTSNGGETSEAGDMQRGFAQGQGQGRGLSGGATDEVEADEGTLRLNLLERLHSLKEKMDRGPGLPGL